MQEKVYKELHEIHGEESPENLSVTFEDLKRMEYTERVIQETLRLFTPLPIILCKVEEDLEIGGTSLCLQCSRLLNINSSQDHWFLSKRP